MTAPHAIRTFGDPVLKTSCSVVEPIDDAIRKLAADMTVTMHDARGVGLAGNQVGVQKRMFTYDAHDGEHSGTIINPTIVEKAGEWAYDEGCLSVPGLFFKIVRPRFVTLKGFDLNGDELVIEAEDLLARIFLHEVDHLDGFLLLDRLDAVQRKKAFRALRERQLEEG